MMRSARFAIALAVSIAALVPARAQSSVRLEYEVKAAFLLNFAKFVEWPDPPASGNADISICIIGDDPFGNVLDQIVAGETIGKRKIVVQRIRRPAASCQIAFFSKAEKETARALSDIPAGMLTVGERDGFLREGGMIAFILDNHRVRFDINQAAVRNGGVRLSSRLLAVARSVEK